MAETKTGKYPTAIAWDEWLASDEGQQCRAANTLAHNTNHYLENRLWRAFMAGANSSSADAEQLAELRWIAKKLVEAAQFSLLTPGLIKGRDGLEKYSESMTAALNPKQPGKETR